MTLSACTYVSASQSSIRSSRAQTSSNSSTSPANASLGGATWSPLISSRPPLSAYSSALARFTRAPKNCICLPSCHRRHAAGDRRVVAEARTQALVGLVLDRRGVDRDLRAEALEAVGQRRRPQHGQVRLGRRAEVVERLQVAEARARDERAAVLADAAERLGDPGRVAAEQLVVLGRAQEAHGAQLHDEVVDQLLRVLLVEHAGGEVALEVEVQERRRATERHRGAVLLLDRGEVARSTATGRPRGHRPPGAGRRTRTSPPSRSARRARGSARPAPRAGG